MGRAARTCRPAAALPIPLTALRPCSKAPATSASPSGFASAPTAFSSKTPKNIPQPHYLIPATNQIVQEFADLLNVIANAAHDNEVTGGEARQIRARWEQLKSVTEGFVAACEQGNFEHIHNHARRPGSVSAARKEV